MEPDRTITFKAEYNVVVTEKEFQKLLLEDGVTLDPAKLMDEKNFKKSKFFTKTVYGKVKNFIMG